MSTELQRAYLMGYEDGIARRSPEPGQTDVMDKGTCRIVAFLGEWYCTGCGDMIGTCDRDSELCVDGNYVRMWNYCPNCGRRVEQ